jgi:hypothetical protein
MKAALGAFHLFRAAAAVMLKFNFIRGTMGNFETHFKLHWAHTQDRTVDNAIPSPQQCHVQP